MAESGWFVVHKPEVIDHVDDDDDDDDGDAADDDDDDDGDDDDDDVDDSTDINNSILVNLTRSKWYIMIYLVFIIIYDRFM